MEFFGEGWREGGFGGGGNEAALLEVEIGLTHGVIVEGFDAEVTGDGEEESYRKVGSG